MASEVAELKQQDGRLFAYHSTGVTGLAYITMKADAGKSVLRPAVLFLRQQKGVVAWQIACWG